MSQLKMHYGKKVVIKLMEEFKIKNKMALPVVKKIVVSMGLKEALTDSHVLEDVSKELALITAQKPKVTRARKSIANFKLRAGSPIGLMVTLRRNRMWEFLERLIWVAIPRIRDFRGYLPRGFDGRGNYTFGIKEQIIFPEIDYDKVKKIRGMNVTLVTSAKDDDLAYSFLKNLGFPLRKKK